MIVILLFIYYFGLSLDLCRPFLVCGVQLFKCLC